MRLLPLHFVTATGLDLCEYPWLRACQSIVRLCELDSITSVRPMPPEYLMAILNNVTWGEPEVRGYAYRGCPIVQTQLCPEDLYITQTFVQRHKLHFFDSVFSEKFSAHGSTTFDSSCCGPLVVCGLLDDGSRAIGHYLPPIVEEHDGKLCLLEGMHRCFTSFQRQEPQRLLLVRGVTAPFPWVTACWENVRLVDEKPAPEHRKFGGNKQYFRHFSHVGLDT